MRFISYRNPKQSQDHYRKTYEDVCSSWIPLAIEEHYELYKHPLKIDPILYRFYYIINNEDYYDFGVLSDKDLMKLYDEIPNYIKQYNFIRANSNTVL